MNYIKFLAIPALAVLASCGGTQDGGLSNAELDAKVAAKVKAATEQLATDCDARIAQTAQMKADSMLAHAKAPVVAKPAEHHEKAVVVAPVPTHHDKPAHHDKPVDHSHDATKSQSSKLASDNNAAKATKEQTHSQSEKLKSDANTVKATKEQTKIQSNKLKDQ